jgi:alpha-tubulin suppressor-like RCC1 family protein
VDGSFAFTLPSTAPGAGTAVQSVVFTPTDATNYSAISNSVSVTVSKATATVVFHSTSLLATCDGTAKSVTATTVPSGLTVDITYDGQSAPPTNAGIYTVVGIISDANYAGGTTNQLRIAMTGPAVAWGMGTSGQLGNGGSTNSPLPVAILTSGALAGKTIVGVAGGSAHSYALTSEGLVYAWGIILMANSATTGLLPVRFR